jgi:hypothetical protein
MTLLVGILTLPFFLWSWLVGKNEEDGELAISLIAWVIIGLVATWVTLWALGLDTWP